MKSDLLGTVPVLVHAHLGTVLNCKIVRMFLGKINLDCTCRFEKKIIAMCSQFSPYKCFPPHVKDTYRYLPVPHSVGKGF